MSEHTPLHPATREIAGRNIGHLWRSMTYRYVDLSRESDGDRAEGTDG